MEKYITHHLTFPSVSLLWVFRKQKNKKKRWSQCWLYFW